jgi:hypothetical protein
LACQCGWRAHHCSFRREAVLRLEGRLAQPPAAIQPRAGTRPFPSAENVVVLKPATERRAS